MKSLQAFRNRINDPALLLLMIGLFLIGGVLGILKRLLPGLEGWGINALFGLQGTDPAAPSIVVPYSIGLALFEIAAACGLSLRRRFGWWLTLATLTISTIGSLIAVVLGDFASLFSLVVRAVGVFYLTRPKVQALFR